MQQDRRDLADRVRKIGVRLQEAASEIRTGILAARPEDAATLLDAARTLDVIRGVRDQLPPRIPRGDMMAHPHQWSVLMNALLEAIDTGLPAKTQVHQDPPVEVFSLDQVAERAIVLLQQNRNGCLSKLTEAMARDIVDGRT